MGVLHVLAENFPAVVGGGGGIGMLGLVGAKFHKLETEVRECRKRDASNLVLMAGVRMMVGELQRELPQSVSLQVMADILGKAFGPPPSIEDLEHLLVRVDETEKGRAK